MGYLPRSRSSRRQVSRLSPRAQLVQERQARLLASKSALRVAARVSTACTVHISLGFHGAHARPQRTEALSRVALHRVSLRYPYAGCSKALKSLLSHEWRTRVRIEE